jgi:UDPglucose 6-dehydrogenase
LKYVNIFTDPIRERISRMDTIVVGLGRIGLVAACCLARSGHTVLGIENNGGKLELIRAGKCPFFEPGLEGLLSEGIASGRLSFAQGLPRSIKAEVVIVAVNSPMAPDGSADLEQVKAAVRHIAAGIKQPLTLVMKSTVPPGTGLALLKAELKGKPAAYVSNPEFLRTGQSVNDWYQTSRIVAGSSENAAVKTMQDLYHDIDAPWVITDITSAEMIKYAANSFLATKVSFINEIANLCDIMDADVESVVKGIGLDPRIGPSFLQPGAGYGGLCLPKDTRALVSLAAARGCELGTLRAVIDANERQRAVVIDKLKKALGALKGKQIAVLGLAFKPGTDDVIDAPALTIVKGLVAAGSKVRVYDPVAMDSARPLLPPGVIYASGAYSAVKNAAAVVLLTEWPEFIDADWKKIKDKMSSPFAVVDARNALDKGVLSQYGFKYAGIGRRNA